MQYQQQMQNLKKDSLSMSEYFGKMRNFFDLLGSVGCRVSEDEQVMHILGGLGQEYDPAVCAISSRSDSWSLGDATAFLLTFESRMETMRSHSSSAEGSQPALNLMHQSNQKREFTPYNQTRFDSTARGGSRNQRGGRGGRGFGRGNKMICQLCDKPGHTTAKCWHRFEKIMLLLSLSCNSEGIRPISTKVSLIHQHIWCIRPLQDLLHLPALLVFLSLAMILLHQQAGIQTLALLIMSLEI
ncbi:uncharacterized protein LOC121807400 [Salvia splendens]|uniref:uncharacterized protein LOC121807400 n=1 Tax=Salvia splendens TaxID=180675 RepID=UPI001C262CCB|nr:uncharacterized protein LOC121807400 [Salvia splendens]